MHSARTRQYAGDEIDGRDPINRRLPSIPTPSSSSPTPPPTHPTSPRYAANNACLRRFGGTSTWMAFLDVDEFMMPAGPYHDLLGLVRDLGERQTPHPTLPRVVRKPDVLYFQVSYCAPCRNDTTSTGPALPAVPGYLGQCVCSGKLYSWRPKAIVRPSKVLIRGGRGAGGGGWGEPTEPGSDATPNPDPP